MLASDSMSVKPRSLRSSARSRSAEPHRDPRSDLRERATCDLLALAADAPELLNALVELDQGAECSGAAVPAEAGAGDDPVVLVEPVVDGARASRCLCDSTHLRAASRGRAARSRRAAPEALRARRKRASGRPVRRGVRCSGRRRLGGRRRCGLDDFGRRGRGRVGRRGCGRRASARASARSARRRA